MSDSKEMSSCNCHHNSQDKGMDEPFSGVKKTGRMLPSVLMSILIAFFPKCPFCWAIYMSMFGSIGLARLPYMPWLFPVLMAFLAFHLLMLWRKVPQKGYLPFLISLAGAVVILSGKVFFPLAQWLSVAGMVLIISGSLLNNFSNIRIPLTNFKRIQLKD
jgi:mercuric ion transport protein